jgi:hypothetical protein
MATLKTESVEPAMTEELIEVDDMSGSELSGFIADTLPLARVS